MPERTIAIASPFVAWVLRSDSYTSLALPSLLGWLACPRGVGALSSVSVVRRTGPGITISIVAGPRAFGCEISRPGPRVGIRRATGRSPRIMILCQGIEADAAKSVFGC